MSKMKDVSIYLDELRESGVTNMFGAAPYIEAAFGVDNVTARKLLVQWMESKREAED